MERREENYNSVWALVSAASRKQNADKRRHLMILDICYLHSRHVNIIEDASLYIRHVVCIIVSCKCGRRASDNLAANEPRARWSETSEVPKGSMRNPQAKGRAKMSQPRAHASRSLKIKIASDSVPENTITMRSLISLSFIFYCCRAYVEKCSSDCRLQTDEGKN